MWSKGNLLYINVSVPEIRWVKFIIPVYTVKEFIHSLIDLLTLGAKFAPNVKLNKKGLTISGSLQVLKASESFFEHLYLVEEDLINVHVGKDKVDIKIKVI